MTPDDLLIRSDANGIATLTLNRPAQRNALSLALMDVLCETLEVIGADRSVRVVILRGEGPAFCSGHDLKEMRASDDRAAASIFDTCSRLMLTIGNLSQPVIAQVHGIATAAGCQLVATCDLAICADDTRFATPGVNIGLFCSTPMVALSRAVGRKAAMEMLLTGETVDAQKAVEIGLVNRAVPHAELEATVLQWAKNIGSKSGTVVGIGKQAFAAQAQLSVEDAYRLASQIMTDNLMLDDAREGIDAFLQKRRPQWSIMQE
ncbi:enoyl-CoA hydratase [Neorhizobium sp. DAR64861/K0K2]|uniref:enoyl-CoA hydratase n=1 Tax=unclassified Neorhizobium TaxID=2629175 RepID=UPI003D271BCE